MPLEGGPTEVRLRLRPPVWQQLSGLLDGEGPSPELIEHEVGRVVTEGVPRRRLGMSALQEANELEDGSDRDAGVHPDLDRAAGLGVTVEVQEA